MAEIQDKLVDVKGLGAVYKRLREMVFGKLNDATNVPVPGQMLIADDNFSWTWKNMPAHISEADVRRIVNEQLAKIKGTVKDTFVHVDDAFPSTLLGIEIEGACRQDGTPSPDNPVPIEVIEHPVVKVTGRNLLDIHESMPESDCNKDFESSAKRIIKPGTYVIGLTSNNYLYNNIKNMQIGNGAVSFTSNADGYGVGFGVSLVPGITYKFGAEGNAEFRFAFYSADGTWLSNVTTKTPTIPINAVYSVLVITTKGGSTDVTIRDIYGAASQITYEPYVGTSTPFTLPAEHPYLAKLPDGTADKIVVDKDGNVELVACVQKVDVSNLPAPSLQQELSNGLTRYSYHNVISTQAIEGSSALTPGFENVIDFNFPKQGLYVTNWTILVGATADPTKTLREGGYIYTTLAKPVRYSIGKIEMPKAQDSIVNVWTDAEVTPKTGIEYVRDVNIVVENLESAIASITEG